MAKLLFIFALAACLSLTFGQSCEYSYQCWDDVSCTTDKCVGGSCVFNNSACDFNTPTVASVEFSQHLDKVYVKFSAPVWWDILEGNPEFDESDCDFWFESISGGTWAYCDFEPDQITVYLGVDNEVFPDTPFNFNDYLAFFPAYNELGPLLDTSQDYRVAAINNLDYGVTADLVAHEISPCGNVYLDAVGSVGAYGKRLSTTWSSSDDDLNDILALFNDALVINIDVNALLLEGDTVTVTVTNWLGNSDTYQTTLHTKDVSVHVLTESFTAARRADLPVSFGLSIPTCDWNYVAFSWTGPIPNNTFTHFPYLYLRADDFEVGTYTFNWAVNFTYYNGSYQVLSGSVNLDIVEGKYYADITPQSWVMNFNQPVVELQATAATDYGLDSNGDVSFVWECRVDEVNDDCTSYLKISGNKSHIALLDLTDYDFGSVEAEYFIITVTGKSGLGRVVIEDRVSVIVADTTLNLQMQGVPHRQFSSAEAVNIWVDGIPDWNPEDIWFDFDVYPDAFYPGPEAWNWQYWGNRITIYENNLVPGIEYTLVFSIYNCELDVYAETLAFLNVAEGPYGGTLEVHPTWDPEVSTSWAYPVIVSRPGWVGGDTAILYVDDLLATIPSGEDHIIIWLPGPGCHTITAHIDDLLTGARTIVNTEYVTSDISTFDGLNNLDESFFFSEISGNAVPEILSVLVGVGRDQFLQENAPEMYYYVRLYGLVFALEYIYNPCLLSAQCNGQNVVYMDEPLARLALTVVEDYINDPIVNLAPAQIALFQAEILYTILITAEDVYGRNPDFLERILGVMDWLGQFINQYANGDRSYPEIYDTLLQIVTARVSDVVTPFNPEWTFWDSVNSESIFTFRWSDLSKTVTLRRLENFNQVTFPKHFIKGNFPEGLIYVVVTSGNRFPLDVPYYGELQPVIYTEKVTSIKVYNKSDGALVDTSKLDSRIKFHFEVKSRLQRDAPFGDQSGQTRGFQLWHWDYTQEKMRSYGCELDHNTISYGEGNTDTQGDFWCNHLTDFVVTSAQCGYNNDCYREQSCTHAYCSHVVDWPNTCVFLPVHERCNDADPCTIDECRMDLGCINTVINCDDGKSCTDDVCVAGTCQHTANNTFCIDNNECTVDYCNYATGTCVNEPSDQLCDDLDHCTIDKCGNEACEHETINCDDDMDCTNDSCEGGACVHTPVDSACDDCNECTIDVCNITLGRCTNTPSDALCVDSDPCTVDYCDPIRGCQHVPVVCDDSIPCTKDTCELGVCVFTPCDYECDDNRECTADKCDASLGRCTNVPDVSLCDDCDGCTLNTCSSNGTCIYIPLDCEDDIECTADSCEDGVCIHKPVDAECDDEISCTVDVCDVALGRCDNLPQDILCDDSDACTVDYCDPKVGCVHTEVECMDDVTCTDNVCDSLLGCQYIVNNTQCDDKKECTHDYCNMKFGHCVNVPDDSLCDDYVDCTVDTCYQGGCKFTPEDSLCNDKISCTVDVCTGTECTNTPQDSLCDDGLACTIDVCDCETDCHSIPDDSQCDDGIACTIDYCDIYVGCVHVLADDLCDDGVECTENVCTEGGCVYVARHEACEDPWGCTADYCNVTTGCEHVPQDNLCDDGIDCTFDCCTPWGGCVNDDRNCPEETKLWCINCKSQYSRIESANYENEMATLRLKTRFVKPFPHVVAKPWGETLLNLEINDGTVYVGDAREKAAPLGAADFVASSGEFKVTPTDELPTCNQATRGTITVLDQGTSDLVLVCRLTLTGFAWTPLY